MALTRTLSGVTGVVTVHPDPTNGNLYNKAFITPVGQTVRLRDNPPDPAPGNGEIIYSASTYVLEGTGKVLAAKLIPETGTTDIIIKLLP